MVYNMSMLRHWFSNERGGGGGLNHLPLLVCKSVYINVTDEDRGKKRKQTLPSPPYIKFCLVAASDSQGLNFSYVEVNMIRKKLVIALQFAAGEFPWTNIQGPDRKRGCLGYREFFFSNFYKSVFSVFTYSGYRKLGFQKSEIFKHPCFRYSPVVNSQ